MCVCVCVCVCVCGVGVGVGGGVCVHCGCVHVWYVCACACECVCVGVYTQLLVANRIPLSNFLPPSLPSPSSCAYRAILHKLSCAGECGTCHDVCRHAGFG